MIYKVALAILLISMFFVGVIHLFSRHLDIKYPIDESYWPGKVIASPFCDYYGYPTEEDIRPCSSGNYEFTWSRITHTIRQSSILTKPRAIGDYISAWGNPISEHVWGACRDISWKDIAVYVCPRYVFTPDTPASMFVMDNYAHTEYQPWSGFHQ